MIAISGCRGAHHRVPDRRPNDRIPGVVFPITPAELEAADAYEVSAVRIEVELLSSVEAFAYVVP